MSKKIAVLCNYKLMPERVGGMDHFFWLFDTHCKANHIAVDWFFPNQASHGGYSDFTMFSSGPESLEVFFCREHASGNYSHIITHFLELCTSFYRDISKKSQAKIIAVDHNPRPLGGYPFKKRLLKKLKGLLYARYIDQFVGVSDYTVKEIIKDFGGHLKPKCITVYNGVILSDIIPRKNRQTQKPSFLVASHLRYSKGIQDLIEAVSLLPEPTRSEIRIAIYGDGPYKAQLFQQIAALGLEANFDFKGNQPNLSQIYQLYDYMLQPTYMECFSLSILESLAANVPVITTPVGGNPEVVIPDQNGFLFPAKSAAELSRIILAVFLGKTPIVGNTREAIEERFSLDAMVENHFKLLL